MPHFLRAHIQKQIALSNIEFEAIFRVMQRRVYRKKELLLKAGEPGDFYFFIIQGCLRTYIRGYRGVMYTPR